MVLPVKNSSTVCAFAGDATLSTAAAAPIASALSACLYMRISSQAALSFSRLCGFLAFGLSSVRPLLAATTKAVLNPKAVGFSVVAGRSL
jgi:hypothetical protein